MAGASVSGGVSLERLLVELDDARAGLKGDGAVRVVDVTQDSRLVAPGSLFVVRRGERVSGTQFIEEALRKGAAALLLERGTALPRELALPTLWVDNVPYALAQAAEIVHGWPSRSLCLVGVTGTNGKTTLTWLVASLLERLGVSSGQIGTLGFRFGNVAEPGSLTTPEADTTSRVLARMRDSGVTHVVMEVTSVALIQGRVSALQFDVAAFTNFTRDHLDFHGTVEAYWQAKRVLFTDLKPRVSVINVDDPAGAELAREELSSGLVTVGRGREVDIDVSGLRTTAAGIEGELGAGRLGQHSVRSPLFGEFNIENLAVAVGILSALDVALDAAASEIPRLVAPPGRLERCDGPADNCVVLVDYAHTPDALGAVLATVRKLATKRVVCVFGCGGDRDSGKREPMGRVVGQFADMAIVTSDNPRREEPQSIVNAIALGVRAAGGTPEVELDRAVAIRRAISLATAGDIVLIAGKGHETYQEVGLKRFPFDDRDVAKAALVDRRHELQSEGC